MHEIVEIPGNVHEIGIILYKPLIINVISLIPAPNVYGIGEL